MTCLQVPSLCHGRSHVIPAQYASSSLVIETEKRTFSLDGDHRLSVCNTRKIRCRDSRQIADAGFFNKINHRNTTWILSTSMQCRHSPLIKLSILSGEEGTIWSVKCLWAFECHLRRGPHGRDNDLRNLSMLFWRHIFRIIRPLSDTGPAPSGFLDVSRTGNRNHCAIGPVGPNRVSPFEAHSELPSKLSIYGLGLQVSKFPPFILGSSLFRCL